MRLFALLLAAALLFPAAARATEVSASELRTLAVDAVDDPASLARLRAVTSVDGQRVDIRAALNGARGAALDARLRTLADSIPERRGAVRGSPRDDAREVLAQRRFHGSSVPGPFRGLLRRLGKLVPNIDFDAAIPGPPAVTWIVLAAICGGIAFFVARRVMTRRIRASADAAASAAAERGDDPRTLERRAAEAEAAGDLETALRLRFRAGLLRLDARGAISFRPSISTYEVRRALHSGDFDALAATFDDVVYGGRSPARDDVAAARDRWPEVVSAAPKGESS